MSMTRRQFVRGALFTTLGALVGVTPAMASEQDVALSKMANESSSNPEYREALHAVLKRECEASPVAADALVHLKEAGVHFRVVEPDDMDVLDGVGNPLPYSFWDGLTANYYTMAVSKAKLGTYPLIATTLNALVRGDTKMDSHCGPVGEYSDGIPYCDKRHRDSIATRNEKGAALLARMQQKPAP